MTGPEVLDVARDAIWTIVLVSSPLMVVGLVVGVAISLVQALTQIQEMTLVFVPKIIAIFITMVLALPFMADALHALLAARPDAVVVEMGVPQAPPSGVLHIATHGAARVCGRAAAEVIAGKGAGR